MASRLATIRHGLYYQDLFAAESLLKFRTSRNPPAKLSIEHVAADGFDDIVEWYDDRAVFMQVKHREHPGSDVVDLETLAAPVRTGCSSLIRRCAQGFQKIKSAETRPAHIELRLISNAAGGASLIPLLSGTGPSIGRDHLSKAQRESLESAWLSETGLEAAEFWQFLGLLRFELSLPEITEKERDVSDQLWRLTGSERLFEPLMQKIAEWSSQGNVDLGLEDLVPFLGRPQNLPSTQFGLDATRMVSRSLPLQAIQEAVDRQAGHYVVVLGHAGSGKSWLLNGMLDSQAETDEVVVYNCFTGPDGIQDTPLLASADTLSQVLEQRFYERWTTGWQHPTPDASNLPSLLASAATRVGVGSRLLVVIDGLDYAQRFNRPLDPAIQDYLPRPPLDERMVVIVSAQKKDQLPVWLQDCVRHDQVPVVTIATLTPAEVRLVLANHGVGQDGQLDAQQMDRMVAIVSGRFGGHALTTAYAARKLAGSTPTGDDLLQIAMELPDYDSDIEQWYDRLFERTGTDAAGRRLLAALATAPCALTVDEAAEVADVPSVDAENALPQLSFLFTIERSGTKDYYHFDHDSLRAYAADRFGAAGDSQRLRLHELLKRLDEEDVTDPRPAEALLSLLADARESDAWLERIDCDWLSVRAQRGARPRVMLDGLKAVASAARKRRDWRGSVRWSQLVERLSSTYLNSYGGVPWVALWETQLLLGSQARVEHALFDCNGRLQVEWPWALQLADRVQRLGFDDLAARLREAALQTPVLVGRYAVFHDDLWDDLYRRATAALLVLPPEQVADVCRELATYAARHFYSEDDLEEYHRAFCHHTLRACAEQFIAAKDGRLPTVDLWRERFLHLASLAPSPAAEGDAAAFRVVAALIGGDEIPSDQLQQVIGQMLDAERLARLLRLAPETCESHVARQLAELPLPASVGTTAGGASTYNGERQRMVDLFYWDVWLSARLELTERLRAMVGEVARVGTAEEKGYREGLLARWLASPKEHPGWSQLFSVGFFHSVVGGMAAADGISGFGDWRETANRLVTRLSATDWRWARRFDAGRDMHQLVMRTLGRWLLPLAELADRAHDQHEFGNWVAERLVPAIEASGDQDLSTTYGVVTSLIGVRTHPGLASVAESHESATAVIWELKAVDFGRTAHLWALAGFPDRAEDCISKSLRSALTYTYRRDTTLHAILDVFGRVAGALGERLENAALVLAGAVVLVHAITDLKDLKSIAGKLIASVAAVDLCLAARLVRLLWTEYEIWSRPSIAELMEARELDVKALQTLVPDVDLSDPPREDPPVPPTEPVHERSFDEQLEGFWAPSQDDAPSIGRSLLARELVRSATSAEQLRLAADAPNAVDLEDPGECAELVLAADRLDAGELVVDFSRKMVQLGDPIPRYYYMNHVPDAFMCLARRRPDLAHSMLLECLERTTGNLTGDSWRFVGEVAWQTGDRELALAVYDELVRHLKEILAPYRFDDLIQEMLWVAAEMGDPFSVQRNKGWMPGSFE